MSAKSNTQRVCVCLLFLCIFYFGFPVCSNGQRTEVQQDSTGKRERTFNKDNLPVEFKQYDAKGNLRKRGVGQYDSARRLVFMRLSLFDEQNNMIGGFESAVTYSNDLDFGGITVYKKYDTGQKKFVVVQPLVARYEESVITLAPASLKLDTFYKKYSDADGIPIVSSERVPDAALLIARDIVNYMLMKRIDIREELIRRKSRVMVMAQTEMETDLPERRDWKKPERDDPRLTPAERENYDGPNGIRSMSDKKYWNQRARGMGGNQVSCAEENLLGYAGTKYYGENILVHEFSHNMMSALAAVDTALYHKIERAYEDAKSRGLYRNQYAINTVDEYWAEGTQWWFWSNIEFYDGNIRVQSPDDLKAYDPVLYSILDQVYEGHHIPADVYYGRNLSPVR